MSRKKIFHKRNKLSMSNFTKIVGEGGETPLEFGVRTGLFSDPIGRTSKELKVMRLSRPLTKTEIKTFERKEKIKKSRKKLKATKPGIASKVVIGISDLFIKASLISAKLVGKGLLLLTKKIVDMSIKELKIEIVVLTDLLVNGLPNKTKQKQIKIQIKKLNKQVKKKVKKEGNDEKSDAELQKFIDENFGVDFLNISEIGN